MSDVTLHAPLRPGSSGKQAPSGVPGTIADPPRALAQLASGTLLRGEVIGRTERGQSVVRTEVGDLTVASRAQLPVGSQVTLQIRSSGVQLHIVVMQVDGHAPHLRGAAPVTPPSAAPSNTASPPGGASAGVAATVDQPTAALGRLTAGSLVQGVVLGKDQAGHVLVRTELGTLPLATEAQLASGNRITLQVNSLAPQVQVLILPGDLAQTPSSRALQVAPPTLPPASGGGHSTSTVDVLTVGQAIHASVQRPPADTNTAWVGRQAGVAAPAGAALRPLSPGSSLELRVLQITPAAANAEPPAAATASSQGADMVRQPPIPAPAPPGSPDSLPSPAPGKIVLSATVIGTNAAGGPQVATPLGNLSLAIKAQLPPGTRLVLELPATALAPASSAALPLDDPAALAYAWPALGKALDSLLAVDPVEAQSLLAPPTPTPTLPQPGPRLTSGLLFFLAAIGGGNPASWLDQLGGGEWARRLGRSGQVELVSRLGSDLAQIGRLFDAAGNDWRLFPFPLYDGSELHQLRLFLRHGGGGGRQDPEGGEGEEATRFVLEVSLSWLGDLQLDGLVRSKRFDLVLRTRRALSDDMRRDITEIFHGANEATGSKGTIAFQASNDWSPMPIASATAAAHGLVV